MRRVRVASSVLAVAALLLIGVPAAARSDAFARFVSAKAHLAEFGAAALTVGYISFALLNFERHAIARAASTREPPAASRAPLALPRHLAARFDYTRDIRTTAKETEADEGAEYLVRHVELPTAAAGSGVSTTVEYFSPAGSAKHPVALILPIMSSNFVLERFFARGFASEGVAAVIVTGGRAPSDFVSFESLESALREAVIADRRVLDWIETRPELDARKISVVGVSLGAIRGTLLAAVDPRVSTAVLALAGGDMPSMATSSSERLLVTTRKAYMRERNLTSEELTRALRNVLVSDPISYAPYLDPERILLVLARRDTAIPYANGLALRSALGNPETVTVPTGHYTSVFFAPFIRDEALTFIRRTTDGRPRLSQ